MRTADCATPNHRFGWRPPIYKNAQKTFKQAACEATVVLVAAYVLSAFASPFRTPLIGMAFGFAVTHIAIYSDYTYNIVLKLIDTSLGQKILLDQKLTIIMILFSIVFAQQLWVVSFLSAAACGLEAGLLNTGFYSGFGTPWKKLWSH